jgi:hypothetical protein
MPERFKNFGEEYTHDIDLWNTCLLRWLSYIAVSCEFPHLRSGGWLIALVLCQAAQLIACAEKTAMRNALSVGEIRVQGLECLLRYMLQKRESCPS